jgi:hypothetical protein
VLRWFVKSLGDVAPYTLEMETGEQFETSQVWCPYCGETVELVLERDVAGELVVDCEVCCRPWRVRVERCRGEMAVEVRREDD